MTGERVDLELQQMDATIFDEFIDTMECNLYCRCGAPNDAVQKMASAILALRAQVAALAGEKAADTARLDWMEAWMATTEKRPWGGDVMFYGGTNAVRIEAGRVFLGDAPTVRLAIDAARGDG